MDELRKMTFASRPLHGEPHRDGNVLTSPDGPVFIDCEAACRGPVEWDLTALPPGIANHYGRIDPELVQWLRPARSLCVTVWCWMQPQRAPGVAEAARVHLSLVREQLG